MSPRCNPVGSALFTSTHADALCIVFITGHGDAAMYEGLFRTCRTGRDWVLTTAGNAQLTLRLTPEQLTGDTWQKQLHAAQKALATRGKPRTRFTTAISFRLDLQVGLEGPHSEEQIDDDEWDPAADSLVTFMQQAGQYVTELLMRCEGHTAYGRPPMFVLTILQRAAPGLSSLVSLTVNKFDSLLPRPSALPQLRHLRVIPRKFDGTPVRNFTHAPMLPQLTTFRYGQGEGEPIPEGLISAPLPALTCLGAAIVDSALLEAVLEHCPNLTRIEVMSLWVYTGQHRNKEWGIRELVRLPWYTELEESEEADMGQNCLESLPMLPRPAVGADGQRPRVHVRIGRVFTFLVKDIQGLHASMADRLGDWSFGNDVQSIILKPDTEIILPDRPAALRAALQQLRALDAPNAVVTFEGWGVFEPSDMEEWDASDPRWYNKACAWTEELERVMAEALPTLPHLKFVTPDVEVPREDFDSDDTEGPDEVEQDSDDMDGDEDETGGSVSDGGDGDGFGSDD